MKTCGELRTILEDCGDGVFVTLNGHPLAHAQVTQHGTQSLLDLQSQPALDAPLTVTDAQGADETVGQGQLQDTPADDADDADVPDTADLPFSDDAGQDSAESDAAASDSPR